MAFFDNLGKKASETTARAMQKAKEMSDTAKLNSMISEEETKINDVYYQIGKLYATMHINDHEEEFSGMIAAIGEAEANIRRYRQQIQNIKGVIRCSQCGAEVQLGVAFCSSCGASMPKVHPVNIDDLVRCESCGAMVKKEVRFCSACGRPMVQPMASEPTNVPVAESEVQNRICPNCGAKIEDDVAFCTECGVKL